MGNSIAKDFRFFSLLKFALPTMIMMVFMSLYTIVDGIFVSRILGSNALSSVNIVFPVLNLSIGFGVMFATGGSAIIARKFGGHKDQEAREDFTSIVLFGILIAFIIMIFGNLFIEPIVKVLGATDVLLSYCKDYLSVSLFLVPACMLQLLFQTFFVTAGKPALGLSLTILGGLANMVLDYIFMGPLQMGIKGAALATGIGQLIPALAGLIYFFVKRDSLYFVKPDIRLSVIIESCFNGSSEMVSNLSGAVITYLYNIIMLKFLGESGVAAITIVLYGQFLFNALYLGFSIGVAPVISFNYGSGNQKLLKRLFKICTAFISVSSLVITVFALLSSELIVSIFTPSGNPVHQIALTGFFIFSFNYVFAGLNIFASGLFTALSNGKISAAISFVRTFAMLIISMIVLPYFFGVTGVWLAVPAAEAMTLLLSLYFIFRKKNTYHYM